MPIINSQFRPAWWLPGPHLQTLWPALFRKRPDLVVSKERLELDDGDFLDLIWTGTPGLPLVLILHGLEGSLEESHYPKGLLKALVNGGYHCCFMHFRGCSGDTNRLPRSYHSGDTGDLQAVIEHISKRVRPVFAVIGFSLGGNVLLKWLGEQGNEAATSTAIAISVPFKLAEASTKLNSGFSRFYQWHLLKHLQKKYLRKFEIMPSPISVDVETLNTFYKFDDQVTASLHGFKGATDYYTRSSSYSFLKTIARPCLILHAKDDPFLWTSATPDESALSEDVYLELAEHGGHVGFVAGNFPWSAIYWQEQRILQWLTTQRQSFFRATAYF